jgi:uncharacterized protein (TIGR02594 family)
MPVDRNDPDFDGEPTPAKIITGTMGRPGRPPADAPPWALVAFAEMGRGVHEVAGAAANPRILEYFKATDLANNPLANSDETPWCSAFVNWCLHEAGIQGTRKANARSWLKWGQPTNAPTYGTICVFWRSFPQSANGHVGFYVDSRGADIWVLGGNQNNSVSIARYPRARLLSFRTPSTTSTTTAQAAPRK